MTLKELLDQELLSSEYDVLLNALGHYRDALTSVNNISFAKVDTDKVIEYLNDLENKLGI